MKAATLGFFLSLITAMPLAAVAKDCGDLPMFGTSCRAATCYCGMCNKCTTEKTKYSCEHKDEEDAKALMAYDSCMKENEKSDHQDNDKQDNEKQDNEQD
ncbi:MAG: hypothetical protein ACXWQJ_05830 [Bdellovibrionota bacterium]